MRIRALHILAAGLLIASLGSPVLLQGAEQSSTLQPYSGFQRPTPNVIFDTDMWSDIDDALALAMLHALQARHEINLVAVTVSTDERWCAPYVDLVDTFYGHPDIPIGVVHDGFNRAAFQKQFPDGGSVTRYTEILAQRKNSDGSWVYPHRLLDGHRAPEAVSLLRKTLAGQPDGSVILIQVGYSTNLARLLDSKPDAASPLNGSDLIKSKIQWLSIMAGNFGETEFAGHTIAQGSPEFNLMSDVPAAQKLFMSWPTPIVASGFEIGGALLYPARSIERDYGYVANHPIAETYRVYANEQQSPVKWPHYHGTFDLTSVLYAARPDRDYFSLSKPGRITVLADGSTRFDASETGMHRYLILTPAQKARTLEALVMLSSQPPVRLQR